MVMRRSLKFGFRRVLFIPCLIFCFNGVILSALILKNEKKNELSAF